LARWLRWIQATWNYSEAGHGKGEADGIGWVIKRTADQLVAHGTDITSAADLIKSLSAELNIKPFETTTSRNLTNMYHRS